ncbi:MAG: polysaccharide deacetylase family protein [Bacteroidota bacterium]
MGYWVKTPWWLKRFFPKEIIWDMPQEALPTVYITFDDGPHPRATPYVIEQLEQYNATATFFCIGKNVVLHPEIYQQLIDKGHTVGNHTNNHYNGWKTITRDYIRNIAKAAKHIDSHIFRPPYGRIRISQARKLLHAKKPWRIYMWDVLSADFDIHISPEQCLNNVLAHIQPGSIVIFHDSEKAWDRMSYALPRVLEYCRQQNWQIKGLPKY